MAENLEKEREQEWTVQGTLNRQRCANRKQELALQVCT